MIKQLKAYYYLRKALKFLKKEKIEQGINILKMIIEFAPKYHFAYFHLGCQLTKERDFTSAEKAFKQALDISPNNSLYYTFLGILFYKKTMYKRAEEYLEKAKKNDSFNILTHNYLALCSLAKGDIPQFKNSIETYGIFENTQLQIELAFALEQNLQKI